MKRRWLLLNATVAGILIGGVFGAAWNAKPYTSTAVLRILPPMLPELLLPAQAGAGIEMMLPTILQTITARSNLINVIENYGLYPGERARRPLEDVVEKMRADVRVTTARESSFEVSFSYPDHYVAQRVTAHLVSRVLTEFVRQRIALAQLNLRFLKESAEKAGIEWEQSVAKLRAARFAGKPLDRASLDTEIARRRYQSLRERVADAEMMSELENRQQGQNLEVLDPPSLPTNSRLPIFLCMTLGGLTGMLMGWLASSLRVFRSKQATAAPGF